MCSECSSPPYSKKGELTRTMGNYKIEKEMILSPKTKYCINVSLPISLEKKIEMGSTQYPPLCLPLKFWAIAVSHYRCFYQSPSPYPLFLVYMFAKWKRKYHVSRSRLLLIVDVLHISKKLFWSQIWVASIKMLMGRSSVHNEGTK